MSCLVRSRGNWFGGTGRIRPGHSCPTVECDVGKGDFCLDWGKEGDEFLSSSKTLIIFKTLVNSYIPPALV